MALTVTANNANGDSNGIDVTAYLADYDATFVRRGYGYFSNNASDFSGNNYAATEQDNLIPNPARQSIVFESGGGGKSIDYTFATHTVGGDLNAISFGYGMSYNSGSDSFTFTQLDLRISGFGFVDQFSEGNIVSALITDGMAGDITNLNNLLASNAINFVGSTGADVFTGYSHDDTITGGNGADTLSGAGGNDSLDGGSGDDLAVFSGARSDYVVTLLEDGRLQIADSVAGRDGTDILSNVELGQFSDGTMALEPDPDNEAPQPAADRIFVSRGSTAELAASFLLANDGDAEGDALSITDVFDAVNGTVSFSGDTVTFAATTGTGPATGGFSYEVSDGTSESAGSVTVELVTTTNGNDGITVNTLGGEASWIDGLSGKDTLTGGAGRDTLLGGDAADLLNGLDNNDALYGGAGDDTINGGAGNDTLLGGSGIDSMSGGTGDDTYHVENTSAVIKELTGEGFDSVYSTVSYTLPNHVEYLALSGVNLVGIGNSLANSMVGDATFKSTLKGLAGNDSIVAGSANDAVSGGGDNDTIRGGAGHDTLAGDAGADLIYGESGQDRLDGGAGVDTLYGGQDNDIYTVDDVNDVVIEFSDEGIDLVNASVNYTLGENVENLTLTKTGNIKGTGNDLANTITGNAKNNTVWGQGGNDTLKGAGGNDILHGEEGTDSLDGGTGNDKLFGGEQNDDLSGGAGNDRLDGGAGVDTMRGGADDDIYTVDDTDDEVIELLDGGIDLVNSSATYTLGANVEKLVLIGSAAIDGSGNDLANVLRGNASNNYLDGLDGNDILQGAGGSDTLEGGAGADTLTGGSGADTFIFDMPSGASADRVTDFSSAQGDMLAVHGSEYGLASGALPDASYFAASGAADAGHGRFLYDGATKTLAWDADGSEATANVTIATFNNALTLAHTDFIVI